MVLDAARNREGKKTIASKLQRGIVGDLDVLEIKIAKVVIIFP